MREKQSTIETICKLAFKIENFRDTDNIREKNQEFVRESFFEKWNKGSFSNRELKHNVWDSDLNYVGDQLYPLHTFWKIQGKS